MRKSTMLAMAIGCTAAVAVSPAHAQVKGAGKTALPIIRWDEVGNAPVSAKTAGAMAVKPKPGVAGVSPTGGSLTTLKLTFQSGGIDPAKPGFPAGDYVLQEETATTPNGGSSDIKAFITLTISAAGKCTVHTAPTALAGWCGGANPPCVTDLVDKCTFSSYQVSGSLSASAPGAGSPSASRVILRKKLANCETGDLFIAPALEARPNNAGSFDPINHDCADGAVVGVFGVANGTTGF